MREELPWRGWDNLEHRKLPHAAEPQSASDLDLYSAPSPLTGQASGREALRIFVLHRASFSYHDTSSHKK